MVAYTVCIYVLYIQRLVFCCFKRGFGGYSGLLVTLVWLSCLKLE